MKTALSFVILPFMVSICFAATPQKPKAVDYLDWARGVVWYQIFPERFCNGDTVNDPTVEEVPEAKMNPEWQVHPWTSDWYKLQSWEGKYSNDFYDLSNVFARRYGGDLIGVIEKLNYLADLGIDAIYFNPVFEAESLHKYDTGCYHHIDDNFGLDSAGDKKRLAEANENEDPETWIWTRADSTFLNLIKEAHKRHIRIVIDGVFNHSGRAFFAFKDILKNGEASKYKNWYDIVSWDDPVTPENEFDYKGWWNVKTLPEFAEDKNGLVHGPREYIFAITKRWMDPNGDGDPDDGIDGWRLDVANEVAPPFWREWYRYVKSINPSALLVSEIWDDASEWITDKRMDNTMNYLFAYAVVDFFIDQKTAISGYEFADRLKQIQKLYAGDTIYLLWNLIDSHDTDRMASMIVNPDHNFDRDNSPRSNPDYNVCKPNYFQRQIQRQIIAFQMTFIGSPVIYYGDEAGMWGADDPDDRKPMVWPDMEYDIEKSHPLLDHIRLPDSVHFDRNLFNYYKSLIKMRHENPVFKEGDFEILENAVDTCCFGFSRSTKNQQGLFLFNRDFKQRTIQLTGEQLKFKKYQNIFGKEKIIRKEISSIAVPAKGYKIFLSE